MTSRSEVAQRISLDEIRYSTVWEDTELLRAALDVQPSDDVLSIMSAGDNALSLLLQAPRSLTAIDMSPAQVALFELKLAGIRALDHTSFAALLGYGPATDRVAIYRGLRASLPESAVEFWDAREQLIDFSIARSGRLERYFEAFHDEVLVDLWAPDLIERLFGAPTLGDQVALFETEAFTPAFQDAFRLHFGRDSMANRGRDPAQFAYVEGGDVGAYFLGRFHTVCTTLPLRGNFYVERFLTGHQADLERGPDYLRSSNFLRLKSLVDRVSVVEAELETHLARLEPGAYSKVQLSDIFEYMSDSAAQALFAQLAQAIRPTGRLAYWNLLVPRRPAGGGGRLASLAEQAHQLWLQDRSWFYRAFCIEEVLA